MKIKNLIGCLIISGILVGCILSWYKFTNSKINPPQEINNSESTEIIPDFANAEEVDVSTTTFEKEKYDEYIEETVEEIFAEEGISVEADAGGTVTNETELWAVTVAFASTNVDLVLYTDVDSTQWMNHARFDKELTEFEAKEKEDFSKLEVGWQIIVNDPDYKQQYFDTLEQQYIPAIENDIRYLTGMNEWAKDNRKLLDDQFGTVSNTPDKYKFVHQYYIDLAIITDDLIALNELNLQIKSIVKEAVNSGDAELATKGAIDEDRVSLVLSWHNERFLELMEQKDSVGEYLGNLTDED